MYVQVKSTINVLKDSHQTINTPRKPNTDFIHVENHPGAVHRVKTNTIDSTDYFVEVMFLLVRIHLIL